MHPRCVSAMTHLEQTLRRLAQPLVRAIGVPVAALLERLLRATRLRAGVALVYHALDERTGDPAKELVPAHGVGLYETQLRHLERRYQVVSAAKLPEAVSARRRGERFPVAITFDDDLASHVRFALPVLTRLGVPATFFVSGASLSGPFTFWWERLQRAFDRGGREAPEIANALAAVGVERTARPSIHELGRRVEALEPRERDVFAAALEEAIGDPDDAGMRAADVRALVEGGLEIGFHTRWHDPLPGLADDALSEALREGRSELEELAGRRLATVAYPHGQADARVAAAARDASFELGYTYTQEAVRPDSDAFLLGRINPSLRSSGHLALQVVRALLSARSQQ